MEGTATGQAADGMASDSSPPKRMANGEIGLIQGRKRRNQGNWMHANLRRAEYFGNMSGFKSYSLYFGLFCCQSYNS